MSLAKCTCVIGSPEAGNLIRTPLQGFSSQNHWLLCDFTTQWNKKAQLSLTNSRDAKACQNCSNSTCLQRCRWQYWPIFIRLAVVASEIREIPRNSLKIQTYGVQGYPRSSILVSMESPPYVTSYYSLIVTLAVSATVFEIFTAKDRKLLILHTPPLFDAPSGGTPWDINEIYTPLKSAFNGP